MKLFSIALLSLVVLLPEAASACAVCFQAKTDATRVAFIAATAGMTFLPLLVVGGGAWWVRRKFSEADARAQANASLSPSE